MNHLELTDNSMVSAMGALHTLCFEIRMIWEAVDGHGNGRSQTG